MLTFGLPSTTFWICNRDASLNEFISLLFMTYINETTTLEIGSEWKAKLLINKQNTRIFMETLMKNDPDTIMS